MIDNDNTLKITLDGLQKTRELGLLLGEMAQAGDTLLLYGTLGAGKTTLTQFIAQGIEIPAKYYVTSPSFNLLHEYPGRIPLYHIDCYRLTGEDDVEEAGLLDYIEAGGLSVIEWPDRLGGFIPSNRLEIFLQPELSGARVAVLTSFGSQWNTRFSQLQERLKPPDL